MGGQSVKRRKGGGLWVWVWRNQHGYCVQISRRKPMPASYCGALSWYGVNSVTICARVFDALTGLKASKAKGMKPIRIRIPAWSVPEETSR